MAAFLPFPTRDTRDRGEPSPVHADPIMGSRDWGRSMVLIFAYAKASLMLHRATYMQRLFSLLHFFGPVERLRAIRR